jgi:hypothetical protein
MPDNCEVFGVESSTTGILEIQALGEANGPWSTREFWVLRPFDTIPDGVTVEGNAFPFLYDANGRLQGYVVQIKR